MFKLNIDSYVKTPTKVQEVGIWRKGTAAARKRSSTATWKWKKKKTAEDILRALLLTLTQQHDTSIPKISGHFLQDFNAVKSSTNSSVGTLRNSIALGDYWLLPFRWREEILEKASSVMRRVLKRYSMLRC